MTVELDDDAGATLVTILKANESADSKESGIYWNGESVEEIEEIRQEIEEQTAQ